MRTSREQQKQEQKQCFSVIHGIKNIHTYHRRHTHYQWYQKIDIHTWERHFAAAAFIGLRDISERLKKGAVYLQLVTKIIEAHYIVMKKSWKKLDFLKDTQNSPYPLVRCCAKFGKAVSDSGGQEWPSKPATNIE